MMRVLPVVVGYRLAADYVTMIRESVGDSARVVLARQMPDLRHQIRQWPPASVVVDPCSWSPAEQARLGPMFARNKTLRVVVYTTLSAEGLAGYQALMPYGVQDLLLRGLEDSPQRIREAVLGAQTEPQAWHVLESLSKQMAKIPNTLEHAIANLFLHHQLTHVGDLAVGAAMPRRTMTRTLSLNGLPMAETLIQASRVARAWHYLRSSDSPVACIAAFLGCRSPRRITREVQRLTGFRPLEVRRAHHVPSVVPLLRRVLRRRVHATLSPEPVL